MTKTAIEWTEETWNPVTGCTKVSPGCDHCYAERITNRWKGPGAFDEIIAHPERLETPLRWKKPRVVFVNSMSDLFHPKVPRDFFAQVWDVMVRTPQHTYQILTKRPARIARLLGPRGIGFYAVEGRVPCPQPNIWIGTSVENQQYAALRIPYITQVPAAVRFLSCEPLLGPVMIEDPVDWVIVGGESGPGFRPMNPEWARSLRDQCIDHGIPFFFKQWGGRTPKAGGRELDGRLWNEMPFNVGSTPEPRGKSAAPASGDYAERVTPSAEANEEKP